MLEKESNERCVGNDVLDLSVFVSPPRNARPRGIVTPTTRVNSYKSSFYFISI